MCVCVCVCPGEAKSSSSAEGEEGSTPSFHPPGPEGHRWAPSRAREWSPPLSPADSHCQGLRSPQILQALEEGVGMASVGCNSSPQSRPEASGPDRRHTLPHAHALGRGHASPVPAAAAATTPPKIGLQGGTPQTNQSSSKNCTFLPPSRAPHICNPSTQEWGEIF